MMKEPPPIGLTRTLNGYAPVSTVFTFLLAGKYQKNAPCQYQQDAWLPVSAKNQDGLPKTGRISDKGYPLPSSRLPLPIKPS